MALHCLAAVARCCRVQPLPLSSAAAGLPAVQAALISGKTMRGGPKSWIKEPWPYKERPYRGLKSFFDTTRSRWDENTRLIVVEGPPAAGKEVVARALAEEFEMQYMPAASGDLVYINDYGYDLRQLNDKLPHKLKLLQIDDFLKNPYDSRMGSFQINWFEFKLSQYIDALAHLMNTGQGVVMNKCVLSDFVYMEAMCNAGFVSRGVRSVYREIAQQCMPFLQRPHLVVYLDIPVAEVQKRIKARARPNEVGSPALTDQFLQSLEATYKESWLKSISEHSEVLTYDVSQETIVEHMVDDIEKLNFEQYGFQTDKMSDWNRKSDDEWDACRTQYTNYKDHLMHNMLVPRFDVPELMAEQEDMKVFYELYHETAPGQKYRFGFNPSMGDSVLFKLGDGGKYRDTTKY
ncbi:NADH dehydrogenase [ubiquinone] 1 alpha subcomplex subunit 10, mitochondrial-like [Amphibalanus amphitrite]|uniref:NADH dehydrogenase [ubiquinone] 1 alpha subcomplex subunit 10, mitochondrial-like n=1 Tax=Amphibalanus amphitrite TaxID=1232801 RepID=UPI001C909B6F|nr:NADH dehydrogenase [ubiquinone] 1 alpha subcomplex subunit 10, mitochondrial-like [Amphibalanus amphitrite]XP_043243739.1 NADH dehydrogenase [ubiquinone] 1 alpha subcomplex subunit 10, mitochondrial-like [Amphibalanus amphitrite]XP_043243746.1 NADH dehydrogenase [ubiquinone] 1 alpha subcomplex subunit 10, mitochondrial-like [Amphibalanus amphitrite]XP_043243754.1 NADH dehydrogenase [ubiquinone] 1 alpha subcomplex subunit 10, mitochondrial-like [Amphibalanus amphitrite]